MRKLFVIGIGAGDPDQLTLQAIKAMNQVDVFFVIGKGAEKQELVDLRGQMLAEHVTGDYRVVEVPDPPRDRTPDDYRAVVDDWHDRRAAALADQFAAVDGVGGILVWGDPALYDSTLRIVERVLAGGGIAFDYEVIPGITSVQALAARHRIVLNKVGEPVQITTGRRLRESPMGDAVVMLDAECSFTAVADDDAQIYWGAYLGMPDEVLISGRLRDVADEIARVRAELRERKGWIMDTYLLRH
ncbi:precorrin-6A synthase (deacetylating) [Skermania sp. ID1734]|uniref:precorrin-6A synthase (deacetylating) n=1 Tax=Skermania sp. ID1734 TaxID=2597516 RepID=UPI00117E7C04|nr:precorrin-6A synthase (deacetylating) [Skermania sp. ID1734]TSD99671.1 precorrin-6A synthase (deacetylating) [Skermania sp. ID1734]